MKPARKKVEPADDRFMSQPKAAAELGCSRQGVLSFIARGELESELVAERVVVTRESVARLKSAREAAAQVTATA